MAEQENVDRKLRELVRVSEDLLKSHGYQIVTDDPKLFPNRRPGVAALKDGRLLVGSVAVFPRTGQLFDPAEINRVRDELETVARENRPDRDPRVQHLEAIAVVQTPDDVRAAVPSGDIQWAVVQEPDELPEEFDRVVFRMGIPGIM